MITFHCGKENTVNVCTSVGHHSDFSMLVVICVQEKKDVLTLKKHLPLLCKDEVWMKKYKSISLQGVNCCLHGFLFILRQRARKQFLCTNLGKSEMTKIWSIKHLNFSWTNKLGKSFHSLPLCSTAFSSLQWYCLLCGRETRTDGITLWMCFKDQISLIQIPCT